MNLYDKIVIYIVNNTITIIRIMGPKSMHHFPPLSKIEQQEAIAIGIHSHLFIYSFIILLLLLLLIAEMFRLYDHQATGRITKHLAIKLVAGLGFDFSSSGLGKEVSLKELLLWLDQRCAERFPVLNWYYIS